MKITTLLLLIGCLHLSAASLSQTITFKGKSQSLEKALLAIEAQTDYMVIYKTGLLKISKPVTITAEKMPLKTFLESVLKDQSLKYSVDHKTILIANKHRASPITRIEQKGIEFRKVLQEEILVRGKITDELGRPMAGVTVTVKGTDKAVSSDSIGDYQININIKNDVLIFTMIGFKSQEVQLNNRRQVDVILLEDKSDLKEVVVVAFGKQKKTDLVGAVTSINPSDLKIPSSNLTTALAGQIAGLIAYQRSGEPGADNADFFIRGVTTFGYKKDPLILIDGIELNSTDLARMQVDDIASFSILKDATSTALYGARGANGVILVTTKEGVEGEAKIAIRLENSMSSPTKDVELADPITYMRLGNEAVLTRDPLAQYPYPEGKIDNTIAGTNPFVYPSTDWKKELFKEHTFNQRVNLNVSGGGKVARYYLAGTVNQDNGVLKVDKRNNFNNNINLKTYSLRSNVNINLSKSTEVGVRLSGTFDDYNGPLNGGTTMYNKVIRSNPVLFPAYFPMDDEHSSVQHIMFGNYGSGGYINPYADMVKGYKESTRSNMMAQFELKQNLSFLTEGLSLQALFNTARSSFFDVSRYYNPFLYTVDSYDKYGDEYSLNMLNPNGGTEYLNWNEGPKVLKSTTYIQTTANYNRTFNERHNVSALLVFLMNNQLAANAGSLQLSLPKRNIGLSGRFTYGFDSRYLLEYNFGYNGSERFYRSNRFGFFPSMGAAWIISNESFFKPLLNVVNILKLRATYGKVGNDAIGDENSRFLYLADINMNDGGRGSSFGTEFTYSRNGIFINRNGNNDITWETATKTNWGLELGLFNKMNILLDIYSEKRTNILMNRSSIPASMGLIANADLQANVGEASAKGMDLSIDYNHNFNNSLWLQMRGNFTYATSKFDVYDEPDYTESYLSRQGQSIGQQWGYIAERLFSDEADVHNSPLQGFGEYGAGDIKYFDVNGDGQITTRDRVPIGYPTTPEIVYGLGFSFGYKSIDISAFFQGLDRESFWINASATAPFVDDRSLLKAYADDHWSEQNRNLYAVWPRLSARAINNNLQTSTWFMRNGAFVRLKSLEMGYTLPTAFTRRAKLTKARFYASGTNLFLLSKFKMWDVEMGGNGLGYPLQRVINLGLQLSF